MGSIAPTVETSDDEITVLVTGYGQFQNFGENPSWLITRTLPPFLPSSDSSSSSSTIKQPRVRILIHPQAVRVSYNTVRTLTPQLWDPAHYGGRRIDYMIHIGMAAVRTYYTVERKGDRDGYMMPDTDGVVLGDERAREEERRRRREDGRGDGKGDDGEEEWCWSGCPEEIVTHVDVEDVWQRWRAALPDIDVRTSDDAGHYLCDFAYYSSLAHLWKKGEERRVVFLHVPGENDDVSVRLGREVTLELIRAMVESGNMKKRLAGLRRAVVS